jgi:hypothetical protein
MVKPTVVKLEMAKLNMNEVIIVKIKMVKLTMGK